MLVLLSRGLLRWGMKYQCHVIAFFNPDLRKISANALATKTWELLNINLKERKNKLN